MGERVELEDVKFLPVLYDIIENAYKNVKETHLNSDTSLNSTYQRRLARLCKKLSTTVKLHSRQEPFNAASVAINFPVMKPKILDQEQEPLQVDLAMEVKELGNICINISNEIVSKWKKLSEEMCLLAISPNISNFPKAEPIESVYQDFKNYHSSDSTAKAKLREMIKMLKVYKQPLKAALPIHPLERIAYIEANLMLLK